jgi:hypothetical protein
LLELTALTRETFVKRMSFGKKDYMVLSRMLKDVTHSAAFRLDQTDFSLAGSGIDQKRDKNRRGRLRGFTRPSSGR